MYSSPGFGDNGNLNKKIPRARDFLFVKTGVRLFYKSRSQNLIFQLNAYKVLSTVCQMGNS